MTTPVHFQSFYLGLLCFRAVFLEGSNATLNILRRSSNTIHSFSLQVSGVQNLLMSVVTTSCWHQTAVMWPIRNELVSSQFSFSWTGIPTFTRTTKPTLQLASPRSQKQCGKGVAFAVPKEKNNLKTAPW